MHDKINHSHSPSVNTRIVGNLDFCLRWTSFVSDQSKLGACMSVKIYNGYRCKKQNVINASNLISESDRHLFLNVAEQEILSYMARAFIVDLAERLSGGTYPFSRQQYQCAYQTMNDDIEECMLRAEKGLIAGKFNVSASVVIKPLGSRHYVGLFCENKTLSDLVTRSLGLHPMPYWDNTDCPKNITHRRWKKRKQLWDTLIGNKSWLDAGFSEIKLVTLFDIKNITNSLTKSAWADILKTTISDSWTLESAFRWSWLHVISQAVEVLDGLSPNKAYRLAMSRFMDMKENQTLYSQLLLDFTDRFQARFDFTAATSVFSDFPLPHLKTA